MNSRKIISVNNTDMENRKNLIRQLLSNLTHQELSEAIEQFPKTNSYTQNYSVDIVRLNKNLFQHLGKM